MWGCIRVFVLVALCRYFPLVLQADEKMRKDLYKLRLTWTPLFSVDKLYLVDSTARKIDANWPVLIKRPKIHVNPMFLQQVLMIIITAVFCVVRVLVFCSNFMRERGGGGARLFTRCASVFFFFFKWRVSWSMFVEVGVLHCFFYFFFSVMCTHTIFSCL